MDFDLKNPDTHTSGQADTIFNHLRRHDPVYWQEEHDGPGFWCITRHEDITTVSKSPTLFGSSVELGGIHIDDANAFEAEAGVSMITSDPPECLPLRKAISPTFMPSRVKTLEQDIHRFVDDILGSLEGRSHIDLVDAVSAPMSIKVLSHLLGTSQEDHENMVRWSDELIGYDDPMIRSSRDDIDASLKSLSVFALKLWMHYSRHPDDSMMSMLVKSRMPNGEPLGMRDFISTFILIIVAGNETTRNAISGGLVALDDHPEQKQLLIDQPELMGNAVTEMIRWVTPVVYMRRTAREDTELGGKTIRKGDKLVLWYRSANRDEDVFDSPDVFDIQRSRGQHLSFGIGPHFCIGSRVAEAQMKILYQRLLNEYPNLGVSGPIRKMRSNFINGFKSVPMTLSGQPKRSVTRTARFSLEAVAS